MALLQIDLAYNVDRLPGRRRQRPMRSLDIVAGVMSIDQALLLKQG